MDMVIAIGIVCFVIFFCLFEFCDLMRRRDDEFPGQYDKMIWAMAIIFTNVLGAFVYCLMKPRPVRRVVRRSSETLRRDYSAALEKFTTTPYEPH